MDFVLHRVQRDGDGGGMDATFHTRPQNAGIFLCAGGIHVSRRHFYRIVVVSPSFEDWGGWGNANLIAFLAAAALLPLTGG